MAIRSYRNLVKVTVSTGYSATATSIVLSSGDGAKCPNVPFLMVWWNTTDYPDPTDDPNVEIILVTARSTDTLTVVRGVEGTTASTKNTASKVYKMANPFVATDARKSTGKGFYHQPPKLSTYVRSLNVANNPDWTPVGGISSITYNAKRNTILFSDQISGNPGMIYEANTEGRLLRSITNSNYIDTEGICWMYDDVYAIVEEDVGASPSRITIAVIADGATTNNRLAAGNVTWELTPPGDLNNLGVEGVTYDIDRDLLYFNTEKSSNGDSTTGVWNIWTLDPTSGRIGILCDVLQSIGVAGVATDLSDLYYDRGSQSIYLISHESEKVIRIDLSGKVLEQLALDAAYTQMEGIAFTPNMDTMFVAGEVDEFARYEAPAMNMEGIGRMNRTFTWVIKDPAVGGIPGPYIPHGMIPLQVRAHVAADTSVAFNIEERTAPTSSGTNIMSSDLTCTTSLTSFTQAFVNDNLAKGNTLWLDISQVNGTPGYLMVTLICRIE